MPYANPIASTGSRFILASILMLPFIDRGYTLVQGVRVVLFFLGLFEALKTTSAIRTSVIYTLAPLLSVLLSYMGLNLKRSKTKLFGVFLGTGCAIWVLIEKWSADVPPAQGAFYIKSTCLAY